MPFLFHNFNRYYVIIAEYTFNYTEWTLKRFDPSKSNESMGDFPMATPEVDLVREVHTFNTEAGAMAFIRDWWTQ